MEILTVIHNTNNYTSDAYDYTRDNFAVSYTAAEFVYIGYRKPFNDIYIEMEAVGTATDGVFQYYNGTSWVTLNAIDETRSLTRSGFVLFDKPSDWASVEVESITKYYIRYSQGVSETLDFKGINTVFANDIDLDEKYNGINKFLRSAYNSFISVHQGVKKHMIQKLRNSGKYKVDSESGWIKDVNEWDLNDRSQLREAGTYYALEFIFANVSDDPEGKFRQLESDYRARGDEAVRVYILSLDKDDDGINDKEEAENIQYKVIKTI